MHVTTITETIKVAVPPKAISGRNVAHGHRTPVERAFLVADLLAGRVQLQKMTAQQLASLAHASLPYVRAAQQVAADPWLRSSVLNGDMSLLDAAATLRPTKKKPVQTEITEAEFTEMFAAVGPETRAACMRAFKDEALDIVDVETMPAPAPNGNGDYTIIHSHN